MTRLQVTSGPIRVVVTLNDSKTAAQIAEAAPFEGKAALWGDEVYFGLPLETGEENPQAEVESGTVAYWPPGKALCLFFGQTPYSPVNVVGTIEGDARVLAGVKEGEPIRVEPV